jgi:hypothetical protein
VPVPSGSPLASAGQARVVGEFIPGLELSRLMYAEVVRPVLDSAYPGLRYSAALIGSGSEVLGFDSARSTDHDWGPRLQVFLAGDGLAGEITELIGQRLPETFRGWPVAFDDSSGRHGVRHWVQVTGLGTWLTGALGFDPRRGVTLLDWLATPTQRLAEVTAGAVFHDGLAGDQQAGGLAAARKALGWYPPDLWRYVLACQWARLAEEEAFAGRTAEAGDELGSIVIVARQARHLIRLWLLMQRRYPPYSKWLGRALTAAGPAGIAPLLHGALTATGWPDRERLLTGACQAAARRHNELGLTPPLPTAAGPYYSRPFLVLGADRFSDALRAQISDPAVAALPPCGTVDQFVDGVGTLGDLARLRALVTSQLAAGPGR